MTLGMGPRDERQLELVATPDEVRAMDAAAITRWGIPGRVLMELAGARASDAIRFRLGGLAGKAVILCGAGNNGGDGYVVARHLAAAGFAVRTLALGEPTPGSDAALNYAVWRALEAADGREPKALEHRVAERGATARMRHLLGHANVVVDALFGTGLSRNVEGAAAELIEAANATEHGLKVALDLPSGLDGGTGARLGACFRADLTVTFGVMKRGLLLGEGPAMAGQVEVVEIGWPRPAVDEVGAGLRRASELAMRALLPARPADGHKGTFGHVGVLGGAPGMEGAAILAARGAMRSGVGLTTWLAPDGALHGAEPAIERPAELMRQVVTADTALPSRPSVLVCGPGLGAVARADALTSLLLRDPRPLVLDADALNIIAGSDELRQAVAGRSSPTVMTPHPLEAARLLTMATADVQADRVGAAEALARDFGAVVILKGAHSLIARPGDPTVIVEAAEPTLAVGGSGDVLAGLVAGLMAQGLGARDAALLGVWSHAQAGREAGLGQAQRGALASEIADELPRVLARLDV